ncbi:MAG: efflux RND transporter periplasmic adaptor subunit [Tannerella sp.]|jgi:HlyD family secretion protein|nr:efflux RND transporter periplasmic adaptor subunit [Tannerella sp.]
MSEEKKFSTHNLILAFITLLIVIGGVAIVGFFILRPDEEMIIGQAEATEVRISGMVPGRIDSYRFAEGDWVRKGDTLVFLRIPTVMAKLQQAEAARQAAQAQDMKAIKGARAEQITGAYELWQKAIAGLEIAERSYKRVQNLYDNGVVSAQKRDEAEANYKAMAASEKAAKSQYDMAKSGTEREDKLAAQALVEQAKGAVAEVESYVEESALISPINGMVSERFPELDELVGTGAPIMNIVDLNDMWVTFSVREDLLSRFKMDTELQAIIPALANQEVTLKVHYLKDMGTYAAWKATKTRGQYDVKTFEVRARPAVPIEGLHPGMSVILKR